MEQEFDISDQYNDWDGDLDCSGYIYIRGHLYYDETPAVERPTTYDDDDNECLFRIWMPKLVLKYNDGREAIIVAKSVKGIINGTDNPVEALYNTLTTYADIPTALIDTDSYNAVKTAVADKIDYGITKQKTVLELIRDMTFPFGYTVTWSDKLYFHKATSIRVLDGTVLTSDEDIHPYRLTSLYQDRDITNDNQACKKDAWGTEANSSTGWASAGDAATISVENDTPIAASDYSIKIISTSGGSLYAELTFGTYQKYEYQDKILLQFYLKGLSAATIEVILQCQSSGANTFYISNTVDISTGWTQYVLEIENTNAVSLYLEAIGFRWQGASASDYFLIDEFSAQLSLDMSTIQRELIASNPIPIVSVQSIKMWGPVFTSYVLYYSVRPWLTVSEVVSGASARGAYTLTTQESQYYANLEADYGYLPYPDDLSVLRQISDKASAQDHATWLQRFSSMRWEMMLDIGSYAKQFEIGDVVYVGKMRIAPQKRAGEKRIDKYFQIISISGTVVQLIEVDENMNNVLI